MTNCIIHMVFTGHIGGYETIWIFGDDFTVSSIHVLQSDEEKKFYIKERFEVKIFANTRIRSSDVNIISRLCNLMVAALKKDKKLPKFVVVVTEGDISKEVKIENDMNMLGKACNQLLEWIMCEYHKMQLQYKELLPNKARRYKYPQFIWIIPPFHVNFPNNESRVEYATALEISTEMFTEMHALELKKVLDDQDTKLFVLENARFTASGYLKYWRAIDATVKYFDIKFNKETHSAKHTEEITEDAADNMTQPQQQSKQKSAAVIQEEDNSPNNDKKCSKHRSRRRETSNHHDRDRDRDRDRFYHDREYHRGSESKNRRYNLPSRMLDYYKDKRRRSDQPDRPSSKNRRRHLPSPKSRY